MSSLQAISNALHTISTGDILKGVSWRLQKYSDILTGYNIFSAFQRILKAFWKCSLVFSGIKNEVKIDILDFLAQNLFTTPKITLRFDFIAFLYTYSKVNQKLIYLRSFLSLITNSKISFSPRHLSTLVYVFWDCKC